MFHIDTMLDLHPGVLGSFGLAVGLCLHSPNAHAAWDTRTLADVEVHLYTPVGLSPIGDGRSLMVVLHGCVQTNDDLKARANLENAAEAYGMVMALPRVPLGGVYSGCWDYYGPLHTRDSRHNDDVLAMTQELLGDPDLDVDPAQVYITGFSSGGGEALVLACLAPDIYAGAGIAAGPALGTEALELSFVATDVATTANLCAELAGEQAPEFSTQLAAVYTGTQDFTVAQGYAPLNTSMFNSRYGELNQQINFDVATLVGYQPAGQGTLWHDSEGPRVALIQATGGGHAWAAGTGPGVATAFVEPFGVDYGSFLAEFFTLNNRRVVVDGETTGGEPDSETDSGTDSGSDSDGSVTDDSAAGTDTSNSETGSASDNSSGDSSDSDSSTSEASKTSGEGTSNTGPNSDANGSQGSGSPTSAGGVEDNSNAAGCACRHTDQTGHRGTPAPLLVLFGLGYLRGRRSRRACAQQLVAGHPSDTE